MKRFLCSLTVLAAMVAFSGLAFAQDEIEREIGGDEGSTIYQKETNYDFDDDVVMGELVKPEGAMVHGESHGKSSSLIEIRADFIDEMLKSVEDL